MNIECSLHPPTLARWWSVYIDEYIHIYARTRIHEYEYFREYSYASNPLSGRESYHKDKTLAGNVRIAVTPVKTKFTLQLSTMLDSTLIYHKLWVCGSVNRSV